VLLAAVAAGMEVLGENRVQEAAAKAPLVAGARWHLVGHLQRNKAAQAVRIFDTIESLDSVGLARRLDRLAGELLQGGDAGLLRAATTGAASTTDGASAGPAGGGTIVLGRGQDGRSAGPAARLPVLLQVNVDADPAKEGFAPAVLERDLDALAGLPHLELRGLMTVGRLVESADDARLTFAALRALSDRLRALDGRLGSDLSMGMSDDFEVAIEEGATIVRVGRAIFGERPAI
jgi:uncharacterized pyridoxal phosphate-containing UPF0001 family protein